MGRSTRGTPLAHDDKLRRRDWCAARLTWGLDQKKMKSFLETVRERVVIYDGAMGTEIQERHPSMDDFWGKENCSEVLVLSRPDIIKDIHAAYFKDGAEVVETNITASTTESTTQRSGPSTACMIAPSGPPSSAPAT